MNYLIFISILSLFNALILHPIKAEIKSFGFDLLHHDSIFSPFYNQSMTESELSRKSFLRSLNRLKQFNSSMHMDGKFVGSTDLTNDEGDYMMSIYIGNRKLDNDKPKEESDEPIKIFAYPSMSDYLTWVRCSPCTNCEYQHKLLYDPRKSDTYLRVDSGSLKCYAMKHTYGESNVCKYEYPSGNGNFDSNGVLSTETFFLKSPDEKDREFSDIAFGCDEKHAGNFKHGAQAVVGLGPAASKSISLVSQLGKTIGEKFSYCLVKQSLSHRSKIMFGSDIELYNGDQKYQAEIYSHNLPFYQLSLENITVNRKKIKVPNNQHFMRLDIQTAVTTLPPPIYNQLLTEFIAEAGGITPIQRPEYGTCFDKRGFSGIRVPELKFHFTKAADSESVAEFHLHSDSFLTDIGDHLCLTIVPKDEHESVLGNMAQVDIQMIFDPPNRVLTFAPLDCTRFPRK